MNEQMSIFDFIQPDTGRDLETISEQEMVDIASHATGIVFIYRDDITGWESKEGKMTYTVRMSRYTLDDRKDRFISCGWTDQRHGYSGHGSPCDSLDEAIEFFNKKRADVMQEKEMA